MNHTPWVLGYKNHGNNYNENNDNICNNNKSQYF